MVKDQFPEADRGISTPLTKIVDGIDKVSQWRRVVGLEGAEKIQAGVGFARLLEVGIQFA